MQVLITNLVINFSLKKDKVFDLDVIALLWPCYGFIAITFIFFLGSLLVFLG